MAERVNEIYSLLVPLVDGRLIIPRACVAEVVGFQTPSEMTGAPPWYIGTVPWNGQARAAGVLRRRVWPDDPAGERTHPASWSCTPSARGSKAAISRWFHRASRSWCA